MKFKFAMADLACNLCVDVVGKKCKHPVCPYIAENIEPLLDDPEFWQALQNADTCKTYQHTMLVTLKAVADCLLDGEKETTKRPCIVEAAMQKLLVQPSHSPHKPQHAS